MCGERRRAGRVGRSARALRCGQLWGWLYSPRVGSQQSLPRALSERVRTAADVEQFVGAE